MNGITPTFSAAIIAPTYNNAATLEGVLRRLALHELSLIVVNDGSTDATSAILERLSGEVPIVVITHPINRGKAAALRSGFDAARAASRTHAITIDTDGQLDPDELPHLLEAARAKPDALVVGVRDDSAADYPTRSRLGRRASNLLIRLESGIRLQDSQCGYRVYPLDLPALAQCSAGHYGFETEIVTRAGWAGCEVIGVPVSCRYLPTDQRISHFRPWVDSFRAIAMHARLMSRAMLPIPHTKWHQQPRRHASPVWNRLANWLNPARAWRDLREQRVAPQEMAAGVAVGVFIANLPIYGLQTLLSLYTARRLHLNPLAVVAGSHLSTPPVGPVLIAAAIGVGHWVLHGSWLTMPQWQSSWQGWARLLGALMLEWSVGALLVGVVLSAAAFVLANVLLRYVSVARD
ncbi:MAG: DUF2062 domain-containing protein [Tepidisphaeraceae bacterium]